MVFWYNGCLENGDTLNISIRDPALLYGATVFTTLRVYQQSLQHPLTQWRAHCHRLADALSSFNWPSPNWDSLEKGAQLLAQSYPVLRVVIFPDGREWVTGRTLPEDLSQMQAEGIAGWLAIDHLFARPLAHYKTGNYLGAWLALQKAQSKGKREAILINSQEHCLETTTGNLWGWKDGLWYIPPATRDILPGLACRHLLNCLAVPPIEVIWTLPFLQSLEVVAYTNCVVQVVPFASIEIKEEIFCFNTEHPALKTLQQCYLSY